MLTPVEAAALRRALELAAHGPASVNPQVGAVILDASGQVVGEGWHEGAGTAHAEVAALAAAGARARGGTAVVTLEPCRHTGRTGPCTRALLAAGVARVVHGAPDPGERAGGGARELAAAGVDVELADGALRDAADDLLRPWSRAHRFARPYVVWKFAASLDGRSAAADGTSQWITGPAARADVHDLRATCDTVLVGTGTVLADDPWLTLRDASGALRPVQARRAVMGLRPVPPGARVLDDAAPTLALRTRDPGDALAQLWAAGSRRVWLEGGPTLAAAFLAADLVDEVVTYLAPVLLGAGAAAVADVGVATLAGARRLRLRDVTRIGDDVRLRAVPDSRPDSRPDQPARPTP